MWFKKCMIVSLMCFYDISDYFHEMPLISGDLVSTIRFNTSKGKIETSLRTLKVVCVWTIRYLLSHPGKYIYQGFLRIPKVQLGRIHPSIEQLNENVYELHRFYHPVSRAICSNRVTTGWNYWELLFRKCCIFSSEMFPSEITSSYFPASSCNNHSGFSGIL